jgi:hypothetical protein
VVRRLTPYSIRSAPKTALWEIVDPYMRFWLRFVNRHVDLIERGRGLLLLESFREGWSSFRGRAIEPLVRDSVERLLPDPEALRQRPPHRRLLESHRDDRARPGGGRGMARCEPRRLRRL